ncbi:quinone oxidoreductase family protein [Microbacterium foliorum]|uniref:quinone oxidoreductase family protein n=1 Tax=Microbacterium foliorum TaxID=104336 RepID=UPI001AD83E07|nr:zinc-binding dehydrogenase [Microbacterium foliorum]
MSIDVQYAGLGMIDALWANGFMQSSAGFVPGLEVSGTVREVGEDVVNLHGGQRVAAFLPNAGGLAEVACAPSSLVVPLPKGLTPELASVVPTNTVTAHLALTTVARFTPGESMLVHAGAGGLGSQFLQVARTLGGGRIDAVVGTPEKQTIGHRLGYDNTYLRTDLASIPDDAYDLVIDPVGGEAATRALRMLRSGGRLIKVGNASQAADVTISSLAHWLQNKTTAGFNVGAWLAAFPEHGTHSLRWSLDAVTTGTVRVDLTRTGRWAQTTEILNKLHAGVTTGKATIRVA